MTPSPTLDHLSPAVCACMRCARRYGLTDTEIVDGVLDGTLLARMRAAEPELEGQRQLVLLGLIGPAFEAATSSRQVHDRFRT